MATYRCDIILVTWNKLDYIKECVGSILRHTDLKCRLIVVDNASDGETRRFLRDIRGNEMVDIKLIFNDSNLGPGKARNMALRLMDADHVCFIDSDVIVTVGWLYNMIGLAEKDPRIGMVNPSSNNFNQAPPKGMALDEYARSLAPFKDAYIEVGQCISFCMLIKAEVVKGIGLIDEGYVLALYEDTDYSMRASAAGYRCVLARSSYVWHHGHGSTRRVKRLNAIAENNKKRFYKKWGRPLRVAWCARVADKGIPANCVELARGGNFVYLFVQGDTPTINHANVHVIAHPGRQFKWFCLWRVLKRRKKKYDLVIADDTEIASLLKRFRPLHRAKVFVAADFDKILETARGIKFG